MSNFIEYEETPTDNSEEHIWAQKYRPTTIDTFIGNDAFKSELKNILETGQLSHLLLYGEKSGTGKTTASKLIVENINCDSIIINASDENNIDTVRTKIKSFASTTGFNDLKVVVLDECLDENTLVSVWRDGEEKKIEIKNLNDKTDLVKSLNLDNEKIEWRQFSLFDKGTQVVYEMELDNAERVICTDSHKWYVKTETGEIIKMKLKEIIEKNIKEIVSF